MSHRRTGFLVFYAAALFLWGGGAVAHGWEERGLCPFDSGNCVRRGLVAASPLPRGLQIAWWDDHGARQEWQVTEEVLKEHVVCPDGEACTMERLRSTCYLQCVVGAPMLEAFDPRSRRLYFSLPVYDRRAVMLAADLQAHRLIRVLEDTSNGEWVFRQTQVSPAGRYLAYLVTSHGSACADFGVLRVFDLQRKAHVRLPSQAERWKVVNEKGIVTSDDALQWESDAVVVVERSEWTVQSCNEEWKRERRLVRVHLPQA